MKNEKKSHRLIVFLKKFLIINYLKNDIKIIYGLVRFSYLAINNVFLFECKKLVERFFQKHYICAKLLKELFFFQSNHNIIGLPPLNKDKR